MRIAVNLRCLMGRWAGVGHYAYQLTQALGRLNGLTETIGLGPAELAAGGMDRAFTYRPTFDGRGGGRVSNLLWEQTHLVPAARRAGADILFCPAFTGPLWGKLPLVVTFHDATPFNQAHTHTWSRRIHYQAVLPWVARRAGRILTVSESAKRDLIEYLDLPPEKIAVVHNGVSHSFLPGPKEEARMQLARKWPALANPYLLFVGTLEPRKNIAGLLHAYAILRNQGAEIPLVVAGGKGWHFDGVFALVQELKLESDVLFTEYVSDTELPLLYRGAAAMVYPSLHEGFGLPPLEAMACGTPVVTSNTSSLPEVVGEAGLLVDPHDHQAIADAIGRVLSDHHLASLLQLRGIERARTFTWERAAERVSDIFRSVLEESVS